MTSCMAGIDDFNNWVVNFKKRALDQNISSETVNLIMDKVVFLPKVIEYDRYQPEFYEDTSTYINKRVNKSKIKKGLDIYKDNNLLINENINSFTLQRKFFT